MKALTLSIFELSATLGFQGGDSEAQSWRVTKALSGVKFALWSRHSSRSSAAFLMESARLLLSGFRANSEELCLIAFHPQPLKCGAKMSGLAFRVANVNPMLQYNQYISNIV